MRYYIAYKFLDADKTVLKSHLERIAGAIEQLGHETFLFYRDKQNWGEIWLNDAQIIKDAFVELDKSDAIFLFVETAGKSDGLSLELGYAKAKGKKIILAHKIGIESRFVTELCDIDIEFTDINDLLGKITSSNKLLGK